MPDRAVPLRRHVCVGSKSTVLVTEILSGVDGPWGVLAAQWVRNPDRVTEELPAQSRTRDVGLIAEASR